MFANILDLIHDSPIGVMSRQVKGLFAVCETVHFVGLCLLVGALMVFDLRVMGVIRSGSISASINYTRIAAFGLALNIASGIVLFSSKPSNYVSNPAFQLKMTFLAFAILNVVWFAKVEHPKLTALTDGQPAPASARLAAALSLLLWLGVIVCGRWLPVTALEGG